MSGHDDPLGLYMAQLAKLPRLSPEEEASLLLSGRSGDQEAMRRLIEGLLERAAKLALELAPATMRPIDAIQEANVVLVRLLSDAAVPDPLVALAGAIRDHLESLR